MQNFAEPLFHKGRVLKKEGLDALKDFPDRLAKIRLMNWADGILYGFGISYKDGSIIVQEGAVRHHGRIVLADREKIAFHAYDQKVTACLRLYPASYTEDFYIRPLEVCLKNGMPGENEWELGRFRLAEGARLRDDYQDLKDCRTAYNTLDVTYIKYAGPGGVTVSPMLLRTFARMILENNNSSDIDVQFALLCLLESPVPRECLLWYLCRRLGEPMRELSHSEIYERLVRISESGGHGSAEEKRRDGPSVY